MGGDLQVLVTARTFQAMRGRPWQILEDAGLEIVTSGLDRALNAQELAERLPGKAAVIVGMDDVSEAALATADTLRVISMNGVGTDRIDLQAAASRGIAVTNTPGTNSDSVADLTLALILAQARRLPQHDALVRSGMWRRSPGRELARQVLGLLGLGRIGKGVALRARGFGLVLQAYDPYLDLGFCEQHDVKPVGFEELLATSDIISLHLPVTPDTYELVNSSTLSRVKPGAVLVNTSRGELVEESALVAALRDGRLGGVALDVYSKEPPAQSALWGMENVILTPHLGGATQEAVVRTACQAALNVVGVLREGTVDSFVFGGSG